MPDLRVRAIHTAIEFAVQDDATADSGSHRHIDQARAVAPRTPPGFRKGSRIRIIFERNLHTENLPEIFDRTLPSPPGQEIHIPKFASHGIDRPCGPDTDACNLPSGPLRGPAQHVRDEFDAIRIPVRVRRRLHSGEHLALVIHHANGNFSAADIDGSDHEYSGCTDFASSSVIRFLCL